MNVAPHVERIDWAIGNKPMAQYVITGDRLILIDTGLPDTVEKIYLPAIAALGRRPDEVRWVLITHADADHIGGNSHVRTHFGNAAIACHELDKRWCSDPAVIMDERYDSLQRYGLRYAPEVFKLLSDWMGPAEPMDLLLQDGNRIRISGDDWLDVHHAPGHTPGHIVLFNSTHRYALIGDAIFGDAQLGVDGGKNAAPPYTDVAAYRATIDLIERLEPEMLLSCHYPVMRGAEVQRFIDLSRAWSARAEEAVDGLLAAATKPVTLGEAIQQLDPVLGPFRDPGELQWPLLAHFEHAVANGTAREIVENDLHVWTPVR